MFDLVALRTQARHGSWGRGWVGAFGGPGFADDAQKLTNLLLGLVKHATFLQVVWYQEAITGTPRTRLGQPDTVDGSFALTDGDRARRRKPVVCPDHH